MMKSVGGQMATGGLLFVTGATGFLGGAVIAQLIREPRWPRVLLLVRAANAEEGRQRVVESLRRFAVPEELCARVSSAQIVCGDLLTVPSFAGDPRLKDVRDVINCAALASFGKPRALWPTNVDGTVALARALHEAAPLRRFVHVGTAMCCGSDAPHLVGEDYVVPADATHLVPYTESKIECERRLRSDLPDLPLVVARPSIIVGHSTLGCAPSPSIYWVFRMARILGQFTCALDDRIDVVPVDYCATALLHLLDRPQLAHDLYHIAAGPEASDTYGAIDRAIAAGLGQSITVGYRQVDVDEIAARREEFPGLFGPCIVSAMLKAIELYGHYAALNISFDNRRLLAEGMAPPLHFISYVGECARTTEGAQIADQMQYDFKGMGTRVADALATRRKGGIAQAA